MDASGRVLSKAAAALRPGGRLLIEQINRVALLREGLPATFVTERGNDLMIDLVSYDLRTDRTHTDSTKQRSTAECFGRFVHVQRVGRASRK